MTPHNPAFLLKLGILLLGLEPGIVSIDYIKSFQCFLVAQMLGHPFAACWMSKFTDANFSALSMLSSEIVMSFNGLILIMNLLNFWCSK